MLEQPKTHDRLWPNAELAKPFGRGVNFEIKVCNVDQLHLAIVAAGKDCFLPIEERWYRRSMVRRILGARQFAVEVPDGYLMRLSQSIGNRPAKR